MTGQESFKENENQTTNENGNSKQVEVGTDKEYEVGYKSPPKDTQFKKGQSGNPKGRPKHPKTWEDAINKCLGEIIIITENGKKRKITALEVMVKRYVNGAINNQDKLLPMFIRQSSSAVNIEAELEQEVLKAPVPESNWDKDKVERREKLKSVIREILDERHNPPTDSL